MTEKLSRERAREPRRDEREIALYYFFSMLIEQCNFFSLLLLLISYSVLFYDRVPSYEERPARREAKRAKTDQSRLAGIIILIDKRYVCLNDRTNDCAKEYEERT